jgi:hypothetical protein
MEYSALTNDMKTDIHAFIPVFFIEWEKMASSKIEKGHSFSNSGSVFDSSLCKANKNR